MPFLFVLITSITQIKMKKLITGITFTAVLALTACGSHRAQNYQDSSSTVPPAADSSVKPADTPQQAMPDTTKKLDTVKPL